MKKLIFALVFLAACAVAQPEKPQVIHGENVIYGVDDLLGNWFGTGSFGPGWKPGDEPDMVVTRDGDMFVFDDVLHGRRYTCKNPELYDRYKVSDFLEISGIIFECDLYDEHDNTNTKVYLRLLLSKEAESRHPMPIDRSALTMSFLAREDRNCFFDRRCTKIFTFFIDPYR